ncbi:MAG: cytochrome P450 [Xenococcaceae cyanobacterium MO_188.B29]|nr:cytochrome P450 [Xenococcaceae cyanobacterium MO_188.B29]
MRQIPTVKSTSGLLLFIRRLNAILRPINFMEERKRKYGDFYQITFKNSPSTIMVSNPQAIEDIFTASPDKVEVGRGNKGLSFLVGDNSLLLLDGKAHKNRRRLLMPSFHGESLQECSHKIVTITKKVCDRWQINKPFKVRPYMQEITLRVILNVVFGIDSGAKYERLRELLTKLLETFNSPLSSSLIFFPVLQKDWGKFSPWGRFLLLKEEIRQLIYEEIEERRSFLASGTSEHRDIFSLLLLTKDENGEGMTDEELHDELLTLLFAGHETTASALAWLFYWIHYLPEVEDKLRFELDSLGENPDYKEINNLAYLDAVISETLRIYPIVSGAFGRRIIKPMSIMGYNFEPKIDFFISIYSLHHREDLYPNSKQFKPERFLQKTYSPYEYIPFGGGNRRCLGSALALLEMKLVIATVLSRFQLELVSKRPMLPVRRGLTIAPPASFKIKVKSKIG